MKFGLKDNYIDKINNVFSSYNEIEEVILYGSRAKGTYKSGSDIDLTIKGTNFNLKLLNKISQEIDDLLIPYIVDLSVFTTIENKDLIDHINRVGIIFYKKNL